MGTTNARTTPALWTTLATLTLLAACTKPEAPPTVQATPYRTITPRVA